MRKTMLAALVFGLLPFAALAQAPQAAPAPQAKDAPKAAKKAEKKAAKTPKAEKKDKASTAKAVKDDGAVTDYTPLPEEYGRKFFCPVMGEESTVNPKTLALRYKGKTYYFCCAGCPKKFKQNPEKYAK